VQALEPLLAGRAARWRRFDFESGQRPDGTYGVSSHVSVVEPRAVIVLDGAYSTRPELADLVDVPIAIRHARLAGREEASFLSSWHDCWGEPERLYFEEVRPPTAFDLVVS
jgi:uridine kinase